MFSLFSENEIYPAFYSEIIFQKNTAIKRPLPDGGISSSFTFLCSIFRFLQAHQHEAVIGEAVEKDAVFLMEIGLFR